MADQFCMALETHKSCAKCTATGKLFSHVSAASDAPLIITVARKIFFTLGNSWAVSRNNCAALFITRPVVRKR